MRVERALVGLLFLVSHSWQPGCGRLAYNLPPASRLMEPGPGVGGPGPGVIPPAGSPYGIYGGGVGRFGDGMGGIWWSRRTCVRMTAQPVPGAMPDRCGADASGAPNGVMQAGYNGPCWS